MWAWLMDDLTTGTLYVYMGVTMQCVAKNNYEFKNLFFCAVTYINFSYQIYDVHVLYMCSTMYVCVHADVIP